MLTFDVGELIVEYCKVQSEVELIRNSTFIPHWEQVRMDSESFLKSLQNTRILSEGVVKAHVELRGCINDIIQIIGEASFERSISADPLGLGDIIASSDDKLEHMSLYRVSTYTLAFKILIHFTRHI